MYIYNVTVNIENAIKDEWIAWMKETHIPDVMATKLFLSYRFSKVMVDEESGTTYSIQYAVKDLETFKLYQELYAPKLQKDHQEKYEGKFVAFRTMLHVVDEGHAAL